jgi:hypothetical protein
MHALYYNFINKHKNIFNHYYAIAQQVNYWNKKLLNILHNNILKIY